MRKGWRIGVACWVLCLAASEAAAQPMPICVHVGSGERKMTREECALKAMHLLIKTEKCVKAEITPEGNVRGWTESAAITIHCCNFRDGVYFAILAASYDNAEAVRLRNVMRQHLSEGDHDADTPKSYTTTDAGRKPVALQIRSGIDSRPATKILRYSAPATSIVLEKQGFVPVDQSPPSGLLVFGGSPERIAVVIAMPGSNEISVQLASFVVSANGDDADRLQRVIRQEILKVLFE